MNKFQTKFMALLVALFCLSSLVPAFGVEQSAEGEVSHSFSESLKTSKLTLAQFNQAGEQAEKVTANINTLRNVPEFGGVWFENAQLIIGSTDPKNKVIEDFAKQVNAKVVKTGYRDSNVQQVFNEAKDKFSGYNAISYRYDNPDTMTIRVAMKSGKTADVASFGELPPNIKVEVVPMEQLSQLTAGVSSDLVEPGDVFYVMQPDSLKSTCSFGFSAVAPDGSNARISAGHCKEAAKINDVIVKKGYSTLLDAGSFDVVNFSSDSKIHADVSSIKLKDQKLPNPPTISAHGNEADIQITGIADPIPGAPVCKSGSYTGVTCGKIIDIRSQDMNEGTYIDGFGTNLDSYPGDSGGGAFIGTKAVGVQSGSTVDNDTRKLLSTNFTTLSTAMKALPGYYIKTTDEATYPVIAPLREAWLKNGGKQTTGDGKAPQQKVGDATIQEFTNGEFVNSKSGTYFVANNIKTQWDKNGGLQGKNYGAPTSNAVTKHGSITQNFEHGTIKILTNKNEYYKHQTQKYLAILALVIIIVSGSIYKLRKTKKLGLKKR
ncbi:MAG: S1 family peptidase [Micrococcaceae bacterium]